MGWRLDWIFLSTGLISLGATIAFRQRGELLSLLSDDGETGGGLLQWGWLVATVLLCAFVGRMVWRAVRGKWR